MINKIIKETKCFDLIKNDKSNGKLSHSILLLNKDEKFLSIFAKSICKLLLCQSKDSFCDTCNVCNKIKKNIHPDCKQINTNGEKISVEMIEEITDTVLTRPYEGDIKIYLLNNFDQATESAQNKILKTLEEPPKDTYFILTSTNEFKILQTILSRCSKRTVDSLTENQIAEILKDKGVLEYKSIALASGGSLTLSLDLVETKISSIINDLIVDIFTNLNSTKIVYKYVSKLENLKDNLLLFFSFAKNFSNKGLKLKLGVLAKDEIDDKLLSSLQSFIKPVTAEGILKIIDLITDCEKMLNAKANATNVIDQFLINIVKEKFKNREV